MSQTIPEIILKQMEGLRPGIWLAKKGQMDEAKASDLHLVPLCILYTSQGHTSSGAGPHPLPELRDLLAASPYKLPSSSVVVRPQSLSRLCYQKCLVGRPSVTVGGNIKKSTVGDRYGMWSCPIPIYQQKEHFLMPQCVAYGSQSIHLLSWLPCQSLIY